MKFSGRFNRDLKRMSVSVVACPCNKARIASQTAALVGLNCGLNSKTTDEMQRAGGSLSGHPGPRHEPDHSTV